MTDSPALEDVPTEEAGPGPRLAWEVPEIAGAAILVSIALLIVGGLATGIARAVSTSGAWPGPGNQQAWAAIQFGAQWASPVVAVFLLGVLGLCWWQKQGWREVVEGSDGDEELSEAGAHLRRAQRMVVWTRVVLALTALGSIAFFAAELGVNEGSDGTFDIYPGASTVAVVALFAGAVWIDRKLTANDTDAWE